MIMETIVDEGQILEFYGKAGDRLILSARPLEGREFLIARYAPGDGPHPQFGKPWSTARCLCLGDRRPPAPASKHKSTFERSHSNAPVPAPVVEEGCEMVFASDGLVLVEFPPKGAILGANIVRVDAVGGRHAPDGIRQHWTGRAS